VAVNVDGPNAFAVDGHFATFTARLFGASTNGAKATTDK
jgi:hypothetical protein